jgi:hypothetical protein
LPQAAAGGRPGGAKSGQPGQPGQPGPPGQPGQPGQPATRITARGAIVLMFAFFLAGTTVAGWVHADLLAGLAFVAGSGLAAWYTRRDALLTVVVSPPLVFMAALVITELLTSHADTARHTVTSAAEGTILTLAEVAPWLFCGVITGLVIAMFRGLPRCVRDLRAELRGEPAVRRTAAREPASPPAQHGPWVRQHPRRPGGG